MTRTFYRVKDDSNFMVTAWSFEPDDPFGFIHQLYAGHLVVTPIPGGGVGFPASPRKIPACTVTTYHSDGVTPAPGRPPTDFKKPSDYWMLSDRLKRLLEAFDPSAFSFVEIEMRWASSNRGRVAWLARTVRSFDTRDPADIPSDAHAFMRSMNFSLSFFDEALKDRILTLGFTGLGFRAVDRF